MTARSGEDGARPRIRGVREQEILEATLDVLTEVGYDRMTLDAVAARANASKASLYRHFSSKAVLTVAALRASQPEPVAADTGNLREDLLQTYCASPGPADPRQLGVLAGIASAIAHDPDFAAEFRTVFLVPRVRQSVAIYRRAQARGEARTDLDLEVVVPAAAGLLLYRQLLLAEPPDPLFVARLVDELILPAVTPTSSAHAGSDGVR